MSNTKRYPCEKHVHKGDTYYIIRLEIQGSGTGALVGPRKKSLTSFQELYIVVAQLTENGRGNMDIPRYTGEQPPAGGAARGDGAESQIPENITRKDAEDHRPTDESGGKARGKAYTKSGNARFREASDQLLTFLSTSSDGTWQTVNWRPFADESDDGAEEVFGSILGDARLTGYGLHVLDQLLGSPIYDPQSLDRMLKQDITLIAADWAYDIKPRHFAAIWRVFADLRDGKIDHDTAMKRTESTRARIRDTLAKWSAICDMIAETGSLDDVIAWAKRHSIDYISPPDDPADESDYRQAVLKEFTEDIYPGAADLPNDELVALLDRAAQQPVVMNDSRRAVLGLLFYGGPKGRTTSQMANSAGMTYGGVANILKKLEAVGLVEKIEAPRVT